MRTKLSTKGQVVVPGPLRRKLGLEPGASLEAEIDGDSLVLTPDRPRRKAPRIGKDAVTGMPVLAATANAPRLTSREVSEILSEFP
jgi:AbrB family looped-hinge helix DNA binding protein